MRWFLRCGHAARQALQVALHTGRRALELREVFFGQTIEPERADLVTKLLGHRVLSLAFCRFRAAASAGPKLASLICQDRACPIRRDRRLRRAAPDRPVRTDPWGSRSAGWRRSGSLAGPSLSHTSGAGSSK